LGLERGESPEYQASEDGSVKTVRRKLFILMNHILKPEDLRAAVLCISLRFECPAANSIGGDPTNASLAVSDGEVCRRTDRHLWCVGLRARRRARTSTSQP
jgi:hypothetical protein